jgi:hypothetical protein
MKSPDDLFSRKPSAEDWIDACVIGGVSLADALLGRVTDADIDPNVIAAFHAQYPSLDSFVDKVRELHDRPESLQGLVSGIKGKLFEQEYVEVLNNSGTLPSGYVAELADTPTQAGWDIAIRGPDGAIAEQLQLKATESASYVRDAIERYPEFEVVVPTDVYAGLSSHADLASYLVDSGIDSTDLVHHVTTGIEHATTVAGPDLIPELAFAFIGAAAVYAIYKGKDPATVMASASKRAVKAAITGGAAGLAAFAIDPFVSLPVALSVRLAMSRAEISHSTQQSVDERLARIERIRNFVKTKRSHPAGVRYLQPMQMRLLTSGD